VTVAVEITITGLPQLQQPVVLSMSTSTSHEYQLHSGRNADENRCILSLDWKCGRVADGKLVKMNMMGLHDMSKNK